VTAVGVLPAFDVLEDGEAGLGLGGEAAAVEELTLEGREETLAQGVVISVAHRAIEGGIPTSRYRSPKGDDMY
jgi:hypothetical protein